SNSTPQLVTQSGTIGGIYSSVPAGLSINAASGSITPSLSTANANYTVTYTLTAVGCPNQSATATVAIDPTPSLVIQNPNAVCSPSTVDLTNPTVAIDHSNLPAGTILSYYYDAGATSPIAVPEQIPTSNTYYIVATAAGCSSPAKGVTVTILTSPTAPATTDLHYCQFAAAPALTANAAPGNTLIWYTQPVGGDSSFAAPIPSTRTGGVTEQYYVGQAQTFGTTTCISPTRSELDVRVTTQPTASVKPSNIEVYAGVPVTFEGFATGGPISWTINDSTAPSFSDVAIQTLTPPSSVTPPLDITTYYLVVTSPEYAQCEATASVIVRVVQPLLIPNIFSPNGDGNHDKWVIQNITEFPDVEVSIFNRYGQFVFKSADHYNTEWDGTYHGEPLPVGAYFYIIKTSGSAKPISGTISIVR
ncbi:MAG TPA: gliding motility-associated C-terminal domain-containing protein, partial [Bacteroidia bacterium]|nr:gliding motility-associated C-terminal domain-containing protein [Bacteroidia bacterium]